MFYANKKLIILFILFLIVINLSCIIPVEAEDWLQIKGNHFVVYYTKDKESAKNILDKSEQYYKRIASELGYQRYSNFWTWENRVKIYIFPDKASFIKETNQPEWSSGMANYTDKEILGFIGSERFTDSILPHEITHLIFRDYIGFKGEAPLWLDEGVAQWMEPKKRAAIRYVIKGLYNKKKLLSLKEITELDVRAIDKGNEIVHNFYIQAVSLVGFLIEKYGGSNFTEFCRQLRDGKSLEEALRYAYTGRINSLNNLEIKWLSFVSVQPDKPESKIEQGSDLFLSIEEER